MRLFSGKSESEIKDITRFFRWVLDVGNGTLPNVHSDDTINDQDVVIPENFIIRSDHQTIKSVVDIIYPDIVRNINNAEYFRERSILTPTNSIVSDINSYILDQLPGKIHTYYSQDS